MFYNGRVPPPLDPASPVPLYFQLAESLREQIDSGALAPGTLLPPLRQAAEEWGVNLHTVRHAYQRLASAGLVRTTAPRGTIVLGPAPSPASPSASTVTAAHTDPEELVARLLREAQQHGLSADELRRRLLQHGGGTSGVSAASAASAPTSSQVAGATQPTAGVVYVIECSMSQAIDLARQVQERWHVTAKPWSLERAGEPPAGPLIATFFHYNDIRARWPKRLAQVQFAGIHPDPALPVRVRAVAPTESRTTVILCEREAEKARHVAADLAAVLPSPTFEIRTMVSTNPSTALVMAGRTQPVLFAPRVWGALGPAERADPRAIEVRYLFDDAEIEAIAARMHWRERGR